MVGFNYEEVVDGFGKAMELPIEKTQWLKERKTGKFIASYPFIANCSNPVREAYKLLALYLMSFKCSDFDPNELDIKNLESRFYSAIAFDANASVTKRFVNILVALSLKDMELDIQEDIDKNQLNAYTYYSESAIDTIKYSLEKDITEQPVPEMDSYYLEMTSQDGGAGFWNS